MKSFNNNSKENGLIVQESSKRSTYSSDFQAIPPIIGFIVADQHGNTIIVLEHSSTTQGDYGPIISYLKEDDKNLIELDLISMYFSSFKSFAGQTNIKNMSHLEIHGSNIKVQIYFILEKYMVITFLNASTQLNSMEKSTIVGYFAEIFMKHQPAFEYFNDSKSRKILRMLEIRGRSWLKKINKEYIQRHSLSYLRKNELMDALIEQIGPVIEYELKEYLTNIPEDILFCITKEIKNKIQDKLFLLG
ncbi:MAG: hypothetical protein ACFFAS_16240 [Promethearchaeota archaeon]